MDNLWQALAALNLITIPAALYYFYRCRMLKDGVDAALAMVKHYHGGYYRMAALADTLRTYSRGLVERLNTLTETKPESVTRSKKKESRTTLPKATKGVLVGRGHGTVRRVKG